MPNYRDGSLSSFNPSSPVLDQFVIKQPFNPVVNLQNPNAVIEANHFNHYFDAILNIEKYIASNSPTNGYAGLIGTAASGVGTLLMAYQKVPFQTKADKTVLSLQVPSGFGLNPFNDSGFSIGHTVYLTDQTFESVAGSQVGFWAGAQDDISGPFNAMMAMPQLYVTFKPTGTNNFDVHINNNLTTVQSISFACTNTASTFFSDDFQYPSPVSLDNNRWQFGFNQIPGVPNFANLVYDTQGTATIPTFQLNNFFIYSGTTAMGGGALIWARTMTSSAWSLAVPLPLYVGEYSAVASNEVRSRCGFFINGTGSITNFTGYVLSFGDTSPTEAGAGNYPEWFVKVFKVVGADLTNPGYTSSGGVLVPSHNPPTTTWANGTVTQLGTIFNWYSIVNGQTPVWLNLTHDGAGSITLQYSASGQNGPWTTCSGFPATDASPLGFGKSGLWSAALFGGVHTGIVYGQPPTGPGGPNFPTPFCLNGIANCSATTFNSNLYLMFCKVSPQVFD